MDRQSKQASPGLGDEPGQRLLQQAQVARQANDVRISEQIIQKPFHVLLITKQYIIKLKMCNQ